MQTRWVMGLASGWCADGVDAALVEITGSGLDIRARLSHAASQPYPRDLRDRLLRARPPQPCEWKQVGLLHRLLAEAFAAAARQTAERAGVALERVAALGCPGHTVWHEAEGRYPATLPLGMPAVVAELTGVTTVSDFGGRDLAAGGQGTSILALPECLLYRDEHEHRAVVHLGGIARVAFLSAGGRVGQTQAFDACPCNLLLDGLMTQFTGGRETYDPGGRHAVQGRCRESFLAQWLDHPYLQRRPPKSLARNDFSDEFVLQALEAARQAECQLHDLLCTATHFVARAIALSVRRFLAAPPARIILTGGGVRNGLLLHLLEHQFAGTPVARSDQLGVPAAASQAAAFGLLAALTIDGVPANLPAATGAAGTRLIGSLTPGTAGHWARCVAWMASRGSPLARAG